MRRHAARILLTASAMLSGSTLFAQDAVPETPPELRDFRLDQPGPQPQSTAPAAEPVTPPPVVRTLPEPTPERAAQTPSPTPAQPRETAGQRSETLQSSAAAPAADDAEQSSSPLIPAETVTEQALPEPEPSGTERSIPVQPADKAEAAGTDDWSWVAILAGILVTALLAFGWWRRRQRNEPAQTSRAISSPASNGLAPTPAPEPLPPAERPSPPAPLAPAPPPAPRPVPPAVSVQFTPEKATISFTALTVKGQLQITNQGNAVANAMQLRAVLLSASNQQQQAIDSFFADPRQVEPTALGDAKPGERLGLALELSVPLSEMQSFPLGDQRLLVPILIATLTYSDERGESHEARLACMIGREAQPPKPKMGALRLDKGPRSFAPLGQRPVFT